jgi:hypothetical protein
MRVRFGRDQVLFSNFNRSTLLAVNAQRVPDKTLG